MKKENIENEARSVGPLFFSLSSALFICLLSLSCSGVQQPTAHSDAGTDGDTDSETGTETETEFWDTDEPGLTVLSSTMIFSKPLGEVGNVRATTDGAQIGVAISYDREIPTGDEGLYFVTFPIVEPENVSQGFYPPVSPACQEYLGGGEAQPYAVNGGFLTIAATISSSESICDITSTTWSPTAEIIDGPYGIDDVFDSPPPIIWTMTPDGDLEDGDSLIAGRIMIDGGDTIPAGSELATFQFDRFGTGGAHETLLGPEEFSANELWNEAGYPFYFYYQRTFLRSGLVTVITPTTTYGIDEAVSGRDQALVVAQGALDGTVTVPPRIAHTPPEVAGYPSNYGVHAFAAKEDEILAASMVVYEDTDGGCMMNRYSVRLDLAGEQLAEPTPIESSTWCPLADNSCGWGIPSLEWSGRYYGYCDLAQGEEGFTYSFWVLDAQGAPVAGPLALFPTFSGPTSAETELLMSYDCDVVPISEERFAVVFYTPKRVPESSDGPAVHIAYTQYVDID